jgi:hypothetical protein
MNALKVDFVLIVLRNISRIADLEDIKRGSEECDNRRDDEKLFFPGSDDVRPNLCNGKGTHTRHRGSQQKAFGLQSKSD